MIYAQNEQARFYFLQLKDKNNTEFSLDSPEQFLSGKALERRAAMNIPVDSTDLPVNLLYINQISATGAEIFAVSKWQNGATVRLNDTTTVLPQLRNLNFISKIEYTGLDVIDINLLNSNKYNRILSVETYDSDYGNGLTPLVQLNGKLLHDRGFRGTGITIAVIDGGFTNADTHIAFDSLHHFGRLLGTHDFACRTSNVFSRSTHGAQVLSLMAANMPNSLIGTAPDANYWLLVSERVQGEYPVEADFWISAAEFADSVGADIITTSLGYTAFNDSTLNYVYSDLDGQTIRASRAACQAVEKGIVVFNSAGNNGESAWHYISIPADAQKIISVGAVDSDGLPAYFSSFGPTADGRIKPELCAMGVDVAVANCNTNNQLSHGSGTSYATPILAGMTACLLQALKAHNIVYSPENVKNTLIESASELPQSIEQTGYGIPNFETAYSSFIFSKNVEIQQNDNFIIKNTENNILIKFENKNIKNNICVFNIAGQILQTVSTSNSEISINKNIFPQGILLLRIDNEQFSAIKKVIN
jgi:subtilisin family serine protease